MERISAILTAALGYLLKSAAQSKTADKAKEEVLGRFWGWIRPHLIKELPKIEEKPDEPETASMAHARLLELIKDESFFQELARQVAALQKAGVKEKNIVKGNIKWTKKVHIGDKQYSPNEPYNRKNVVEGDVENVDKFILGDGH